MLGIGIEQRLHIATRRMGGRTRSTQHGQLQPRGENVVIIQFFEDFERLDRPVGLAGMFEIG